MSRPSRWQRYFALMGWLIGDLWRFAKWRIIGVVMLNLIGVVAQVAAIGVLMLFVQAQTTGQPVVIGPVMLTADTSLGSLLTWGGTVLGLSLVAAGAMYWVQVVVLRVAAGHMNCLAGSILEQAKTHRADGDRKSLRRVLTGYLLMLYRAERILLQFPAPLLTLVVAVIVLVLLNAALTGLVAILMLGYVVPFFLVNRGVVEHSRVRDESRAVLGTSVNELIDQVRAEETLDCHAAFSGLPALITSVGAFRGILLSRARISLLQQVFLGILLSGAVVVFGFWLVRGGASWAAFLTYLVALRFAASSMTRAATTLTATNRFVPQLAQVKRATENLSNATGPHDTSDNDADDWDD